MRRFCRYALPLLFLLAVFAACSGEENPVLPGGGGASTNCVITGLSINGTPGIIDGTNITVTMAGGTDLSSLAPVITISSGATVSPASGVVQNFNNSPLTYQVTAQDGVTFRRYAVTARTNSGGGIITWYTETFDNATATGSTYKAGQSSSNGAGITWSFWGRTDQPIETGQKSLLIGKDGTGYLQATLPNGCGKLRFRFKKAFSDNPAVVVKVDGVTVHTTVVATDLNVIQDSGEILVNTTGSCVLRLEAGGGGNRVIVDDVAWTDGTPAEGDPPTVAISSPTDGGTVNAYQLAVSGTAADPGAGASGVSEVWAQLDSESYVKVSGTTSWNHTFNTVSAGSHTVRVYAKDTAGNVSTISTISVTVTHPVDTTAPGAAFTSPAAGASVSPGVTVQGTASDDLSGVKEVWVRVDSGSYVKATGTTSWSCVFGSLAPGAHTFSAYAVDNAGNNSTPVTRSVTVTLPAWTVMVYLVADNDLEAAGVDDFQEMERGIYDAVAAGNGGITNNVNIIVMFDRHPGESTADGNWSDTRLFRILPDNTSTSASTRLDDGNTGLAHHIANLGEKQMDDPAVLSWFLGYCKTEFPAQNYGLILWNHGGGTRSARSTTRPLKDVCYDLTSSSQWYALLYTDEVQQAVAANFSSGSKLGFIGFDACLMGMVETAYEFRNLAQYFIGSMQSEQGDGWDYTYIFSHMGDGSAITPEAFAKLLVTQYSNFQPGSGETMAASDLTKMTALKTAIDALAVAIYGENKKSAIESVRNASVNYLDPDPAYSEYTPFYDLYDFCNRIQTDSVNGFSAGLKTAAGNVITALQAAIIRCFGQAGNGQPDYYFSDADAKRGLSIFFSNSSTDWANQGWYTIDDHSTDAFDSTTIYGNIDFCTYSGSGVATWRDLMEAWY